MYTDFTLRNFRVFDEEGISIPLRPITILTGCNNSGKSSITKALCLLKDFCAQIESDFEDGKRLRLERYKMDFHKKPNDIMGVFDLVVHCDKSNSIDTVDEKAQKTITFEVVVESSWLLQDVILRLEFAALVGDDLNNGYLNSVEIKTMKGDVIYKASRKGNASYDFCSVKSSLLFFIYGQHAFSKWQSELSYRMATSTEPYGEDEDAKEFEESINSLLDNLGANALIYLLEWQVSHGHQTWRDGSVGPAGSIIGKVEKSFIKNSPQMNVFCFYPCFEIFQNMEKEEIKTEVNELIRTQKTRITPLEKKIVKIFLDSFKKSDAETLHDFISQKENVFFSDPKMLSIGHSSFPFEGMTMLKHDVNSYIFDKNDLPEEANWTVCILALDIINKISTGLEKSYVSFDEVNESEYYMLENKIDSFLQKTLEDIFSKIMPGSFTYSPTTIVRPQRLYSLEDDSDFIDSIKRFFELKRLWISEVEKDKSWEYKHKDKVKHQPCSFINKWLNQLGIAHHVDIKSHVNGYGATIHLFDSEEDEKGMLLADKGFGVLQLFAFLLKIENAIVESQIIEVRYPNYTDGLSKDIIKYLRSYNQLHPLTIALEEPECHLHPSLQSKFADIISDANTQFGIHFLIESHSEYFIRRLQLLVAQKVIKNEDVSLLYVNAQNRHSYTPAISDIGIDPDGTLKNEFGPGFFDESLRLSKELFRTNEDDNKE